MSCRLLETERLRLRVPEAGDIPAMVPLANDYDVAKNLARVPHPFHAEHAEDFIARQAEDRAKGSGFAFAVTQKDTSRFMGICGLHLHDNGLFELGYWLGQPYWGQGYATEAARKVAGFAFHALKANRITAGYFHDNPASGHVLEKVGFRPNGAGERDCAARGHAVYCLDVLLEREHFGRPAANRAPAA